MKLGYFTMPLHPVGRDWRQTLAEDREAILLADRLGFEEAFIGEHVTDLAETITSCLIFIATLARDTKRIRLGSGTVNLANRHPAATAAEIAMVDTLLEGRFILGVGPGSNGIAAAAERGWTPISANFVHPWVVKTHWSKYVEGCTRAGRKA